MQKSEFEKLMERYLKNEVSEEEKDKIEAWLDVIKTDDNTDLELSQKEEERIFQRLTDKLSSVDDIKKLKPIRKIRPDQWVVRIAASLIIVSLLSYMIWYFVKTQPTVQQSITSADGIGKVILDDGSIVWMQSSTSKIRYSEKEGGGVRFCELEGEALFEVAKDPTRPFIVQSGDVQVKVVGTSFSIRSESGHNELAVFTGKVNISNTTNQEGLFVLPNEKVIWIDSGPIEKVVPLSVEEKATLIARTTYNMKFEKASMLEIAKNIEEKFNVQLTTSDPTILDCRITADFTDQSLSSTLQMITEVLDVQYELDGNKVTITGSGCQ